MHVGGRLSSEHETRKVRLPRSLWFECRAGWSLRTTCADLLKETKSGMFLGPMATRYIGPVKLIA